MAEAFVNTIKRDSVGGADPSDSDTVPRQLPVRTEAYNRVAPRCRSRALLPLGRAAETGGACPASCLAAASARSVVVSSAWGIR